LVEKNGEKKTGGDRRRGRLDRGFEKKATRNLLRKDYQRKQNIRKSGENGARQRGGIKKGKHARRKPWNPRRRTERERWEMRKQQRHQRKHSREEKSNKKGGGNGKGHLERGEKKETKSRVPQKRVGVFQVEKSVGREGRSTKKH